MKSRAVKIISGAGITIILVGVLFVVLSMLRAASHISWQGSMSGNIKSLAVYIKIFNEDNGHYPTSLDELVRETWPENHKDLTNTLSRRIGGSDKNQYDYKPLSNGFVIIATKPGSLLSPKEKMEKSFQSEAQQQNQPAQ